jgi:hypothetical protein
VSERTVMGWQPWLPWPLSAWRWWTEPVRAEHLAVLRIGLAAVLLCDIFLTYLPRVDAFFGPNSLGSPELFEYMHRAGRWNWSLWHGLGNPLLSCLALLIWIASTVILILGFLARRASSKESHTRPLPRTPLVWLGATIVVVLGQWSRMTADPGPGAHLSWIAPLTAWGLVNLFLLAELVRWRNRSAPDWSLRRTLFIAWGVAALQVLLGIWRCFVDPEGLEVMRAPLMQWETNPQFLRWAMVFWVGATACLLLGLATRWAAVLVWISSLSFAHLNSYIDNAGDTVRGIILFYLMLCPCGAAWSLDRLWSCWRGRDRGIVYVHPWPLRLLFVQMVLIYWMNGLYKILASDWVAGESLYYVMCDLALTRFSYAQFPVPLLLTRVLTLVILIWELTFPVWMFLRRTRVVALWMGALFHLGIFVTMELGGFAPYMLCLYLPLLPWDRWLRSPK